MVKGGLTLLALLLASPVAAAPELLTSTNPQSIANLLKAEGLPAELGADPEGNPQIITGLSGHRVNIWFYDCEQARDCHSVQFQLGMLMDNQLSTAQVNAFNQNSRFATLSLDEDNDPILRHDLWMPPPGIAKAAFVESLRAFGTGIELLWAMVSKAENAP